MSPHRPLGPVLRWYDEQGDPVNGNTADLPSRWRHLQEGASLGAMLVHCARIGSHDELAVAVHVLSRRQLEAAVYAMALVHAEADKAAQGELG